MRLSGIARLSRALGCGDFVKVEVIPDAKYLLPDNAETIRATEILAKEGFHVLPYMYPDLIAARHLVDAGVAAVMPLGAPIGSNKGLRTKDFTDPPDEIDLPVIVDAGTVRRHRRARQWKWALPQLWRTLLLQLRTTAP